MATDYDSDSTEGDYTETNVLLGYASRDGDPDAISKLGGRPDWLEPDAPPSAGLARCKACGVTMALLLQLNAELPERFPGHERRIYVFACRRPACRRKDGSVCALRGVRAWEAEQQQPPQPQGVDEGESCAEGGRGAEPGDSAGPAAGGLGDRLFGAAAGAGNPFATNANPFSTRVDGAAAPSSNGNDAAAAVPALTKTFAESLSLTTPPATEAAPAPAAAPTAAAAAPGPAEPWPPTSQQPAPYPVSYLGEADYETLDPTPTKAVPEQARLMGDDEAEPSGLDREAFESAMDATFQKFADRLAQNPDHVLRYEFAGLPLLYSKTDRVGRRLLAPGQGFPPCPACRAPRVFELQLTPNAIAELEADDASLEGMEWGTIIVGVCERDCVPRNAALGEAGYLEEWAGVQWEELTKHT